MVLTYRESRTHNIRFLPNYPQELLVFKEGTDTKRGRLAANVVQC
jgi:hypothetical protein